MQSKWSKIGAIFAGIAMVGALGAPFVANNQAEDNANSIDNIATQLTALDEKVDAGIDVNVAELEEGEVSQSELTQSIHDKIFEDDAWESEAEVIATEEWEERDYDDIADAINKLYPVNQIDDEDDIEYVREDENTEFINMDADDRDGKVIQYVKVKYENERGKDVKKYLTITSTFDEGDLEDQEITVTA